MTYCVGLVDSKRAAWAKRVGDAWNTMIEGVLAAGKALIEAKAALAHGDFGEMIKSDLPFSASTAQMLMKIARTPELAKTQNIQLLPPHWGTLYELTKLKPETLSAAIAEGRVRPDMERKDAVVLRTGDRRVERLATAERLAQSAPPPLAELAAKRRWPVVYADPPWRFETWSEAGKQKSPDNHYPTMTRDEIASLPVSALAAARRKRAGWDAWGNEVPT
jgi:hypothetical protein